MQVEKIKEAYCDWVIKEPTQEEIAFSKTRPSDNSLNGSPKLAVGFYAGYLAAIASLDEKATDSGDADMIDFLCGDKDYFILRGKKVTRDMLNTMRFSSNPHAQKCAECGKGEKKVEKTCWNCAIQKGSSNCLKPDHSFYTICTRWTPKPNPLKEKQGE